MAVIVTIALGSEPTLTLAPIAQEKPALKFTMPPLDVTKGQALA
jgi:hypothetical protein